MNKMNILKYSTNIYISMYAFFLYMTRWLQFKLCPAKCVVMLQTWQVNVLYNLHPLQCNRVWNRLAAKSLHFCNRNLSSSINNIKMIHMYIRMIKPTYAKNIISAWHKSIMHIHYTSVSKEKLIASKSSHSLSFDTKSKKIQDKENKTKK